MRTLVEWRKTRQLELRVQLLKAVAHPVRLCVVGSLAERALCVNELADALGVAQPIVSQQLRILRMMGLVKTRRDGRRALYELAEPHLHGLLACLDHCCDERAGARPAPARRAVKARQAVTRRRGTQA